MNEEKILEAWDLCNNSSNLRRGLVLTSLFTNKTIDEIAGWSVEKRDIALLNLRQLLFGGEFNSTCPCPNCSRIVEWQLSYQDLKVPDYVDVPDNMTLTMKGENSFTFRLPNSYDLLKYNSDTLLSNCIIDGYKKHSEVDQLSVNIQNQMEDLYEEVCEFSNIYFDLKCVDCDHEWQSLFDVLSYLWNEIDVWAKRFLNQVFILAKHLGWSEKEIIKMNRHRRNYYLSMIHSI